MKQSLLFCFFHSYFSAHKLVDLYQYTCNKENENDPFHPTEGNGWRRQAKVRVQAKKRQVAQRITEEYEVWSCEIIQIKVCKREKNKDCHGHKTPTKRVVERKAHYQHDINMTSLLKDVTTSMTPRLPSITSKMAPNVLYSLTKMQILHA